MKEGFFEWIASYEDVKKYLQTPYVSVPIAETKALVIGNGTSTLAESLATDLSYPVVYAIDNDIGCTQHMNINFSESIVQYHSYDMVDGLQSTDVDTSILPPALTTQHHFNVIIDKGTFDAILVEGSVASMLFELLRLLDEDGVYVLFSINKSTLLDELFSFSQLYLDILHNETLLFSNQTITMMICRKQRHNPGLTVDDIANHEEIVMNAFFQMDAPFLTADQKQRIQQQFDRIGKDGMELSKAYKILFEGKEGLGYDYDLFLDDLQSFSLARKDRITFPEAMDFIDAMQ